MPSYDFKCICCGYRFDAIVPTHEQSVPCPICKDRCDRLPAAPAFHLKGSGWDKEPPKEKP